MLDSLVVLAAFCLSLGAALAAERAVLALVVRFMSAARS